jgi:hypothetical protein
VSAQRPAHLSLHGHGLLAAPTEINWTRAVRGVPAVNYCTRLRRSTAFAPFQPFPDQSYPDPIDRQVDFGLLWIAVGPRGGQRVRPAPDRPGAQLRKATVLLTGKVIDVCDRGPRP